MATTSIKKNKKDNIPVVKGMRDYSNDPTFKKKAEEAAALIKKYGLPKSAKKKN